MPTSSIITTITLPPGASGTVTFARPDLPRTSAMAVHSSPGRSSIAGTTGPDSRSYRVDFSRARDELGYRAEWSIHEGAAELYKQYSVNDLDAQQFQQQLTRLEHLRRLCEAEALDRSLRWVNADA